jgi:hypothetical protein
MIGGGELPATTAASLVRNTSREAFDPTATTSRRPASAAESMAASPSASVAVHGYSWAGCVVPDGPMAPIRDDG